MWSNTQALTPAPNPALSSMLLQATREHKLGTTDWSYDAYSHCPATPTIPHILSRSAGHHR